MLKIILILLISYLVGSVPPSYIMGWLLKGIDIRKYGSGNVGVTNALRVLGPLPALICAILDPGKGIFAIWLAHHYLGANLLPKVLAGIFAIIGHNWTIFLNFKGGKGVATTLGVLLALVPEGALLFFIIWLLVVGVGRYVSLGSLSAAALLPFGIGLLRKPPEILFFSLLASALIIYRHKANIKRLLAGEEHRLGERVKVS